MNARKGFIASLVVSLVLTLAGTTLVAAQDQVLYNFGSITGDLTTPTGNLVLDQSGNTYGVALDGGSGAGGIFELSPSSSGTWTEQIIYKASKTTDGLGPNDSLTIDGNGNLYATTFNGGSSTCSCGQVFELSPTSSGWTKTVLHTFNNGYTGGFPASGVIFDAAGNLYGTTTSGGISNTGVVYELSPSASGWTIKTLYSFTTPVQGNQPRGNLLLDSAGRLYGTTPSGGITTCSEFGCGTVFQLSPPTTGTAWTYRRIFAFNFTDGVLPSTDSLVMDTAGNLYGTTANGGGRNNGEVYELSPVSSGVWREKVIYAFTGGADGGYPAAGLTFDASGNLWGTTEFSNRTGDGTVYELTPGTGGQWGFSTVYSFTGSPNDGQNPLGKVIFDSAGNLYGTTQKGGTQKKGVVYELPGALSQAR